MQFGRELIPTPTEETLIGQVAFHLGKPAEHPLHLLADRQLLTRSWAGSATVSMTHKGNCLIPAPSRRCVRCLRTWSQMSFRAIRINRWATCRGSLNSKRPADVA